MKTSKKVLFYNYWVKEDRLPEQLEAYAATIKLDPSWANRYVKEFEAGYEPPDRKIPKKTTRKTKLDRDEEGVDVEIGLDGGSVRHQVFNRWMSVDEILEEAHVDTEKWQAGKLRYNKWAVTLKLKKEIRQDKDGRPVYEYYPHTVENHQTWIELIPKRVDPFEAAIDLITERIPKFPRIKSIPEFKPDSSDFALELAPLDAHFGKLAWGMEIGRKDYDLGIACEDYLGALEKTLSWGKSFKPSQIYYVLGQDYLHVENYDGKTSKAGHILDTDSRLPKLFAVALEIAIRSVEMARALAPVRVLWVPGNHDGHMTMGLAHAVKQRFYGDAFVTVDVTPEQRKIIEWGYTAIMLCHQVTAGKAQAWQNEFALNFPDVWARTQFREVHHGHLHKKSEIKMFPTTTQGGVLMRQLTALSPIDFWHYENLFTDAVPGGEAFLLSKRDGVVANYVAWTKNYINRGARIPDEPKPEVRKGDFLYIG